jgi:ZIP family zinc transporter
MNLVAQAALLVSFPVVASAVGAVVAALRPPGPRVVSGVQHFAAGVVTAALVGEIMPELQREGHLAWTVLGFAAGALLVLTLGAYGRHTEAEAEAREAEAATREAEALAGQVATREAEALAGQVATGQVATGRTTTGQVATGQVGTTTGQAGGVPARGILTDRLERAATMSVPVGMLAAIAIDLLLDGILVGLGARLGLAQGVILTIALTLEILFLALSVSAELTERGMSQMRAALTCTALGLTTAVGAIAGAALLGGVSTSVMSAVLAFGAAALLYLVVEELLVEAHEEKESMLLGAMFFLGFIVIYVLSSLGA